LVEGQLGKLLMQAQKLQADMARVQEQLKEQKVEAVAEGGAIKIVANGQQEITDVYLDSGFVHPANTRALQLIIRAAVNNALNMSRELAKNEMMKATGGLNLSNFTGLL